MSHPLQALRRMTLFPCRATVADIGPRFGLRLRCLDPAFRRVVFEGLDYTQVSDIKVDFHYMDGV